MTSASSTDSVSAMKVSNLALPDSIPPSILASADLLVTKTAYLSGMVAPETAACLSRLMRDSDTNYSRIIDGHHTEPEVLKDEFNSANQQSTLEKVPELRRRIVTALVHHFHLLQIQTFPDGKGAVARVVIHQHFAQLGLHPHLWSLARGLARRHDEYHTALATTDRTRASEIDGGLQQSSKASLSFVEFMLDVCIGEVDYMTAALNTSRLREAVMHVFRTHLRLTGAEIRPQIGPVFLALLIQGALPRREFETFTGLQPSEACDQLNKLINIGLVVSSASNRHTLRVGLPTWFAQDIFPDFSLVESEIKPG
jgi:Fic family protein